MRTRAIVALLLVMATIGCASRRPARSGGAGAEVLVGASAIDITPEEPIRLTGYGSRTEPAGEIRQRLSAKALAFGGKRQPSAVLIATDLIGVPHRLTQEIARRLQKAGVAREQVVVTATHTHTGPMLSGTLPYIFGAPIPQEHQAASDRYTRQLVDKLERVALAALADRRPARLSWGQGRAGFAANRRVLKEGKWTAFGINPNGPVDHDLPVLAVHATDGALRAVLASYACHATTLEGKDNFVHGDWPGVAQEMIQSRHPGVVAMITIGAGADTNPNPRGGGIRDVERNAKEVADEVDRVLQGTLRSINVSPTGRVRVIDLSFSKIPSRQVWQQRATKADAYGMFARDAIARLDRGERIAETAPYPIQTWTFGNDLAMVFLAGEVVSDYGLRLKRELDASRLWVNAYSNDVAFYVASKRMIPEGGYEVDRSMAYYGQPAALAEGTEDQIIAAVRQLLPASYVRWAGENSK